MKCFQGRRCAVGLFGEKYICDQCLYIHIRVVGEEKTPLVPDDEPEDFLPQLPLEEYWDEDLPDVLLYLLSLICWLLMTNYLCRVLLQIHVLPPLPQVHSMCQAPGGLLVTDEHLILMEEDNEKH